MVSYLTLLPSSKDFTRVVHSQCCYELVLAIFIDANRRIKSIQMGDHVIKKVNFAYDTTNLLRDFGCLTKIKLILELSQKSSSSKINFQKAIPYGVWHIKIELINQNKWLDHNSLSKWLEYIFIILLIITRTGTKFIFGTECSSLWEEKK